jgi:hypothetical protein
MIEAAGFGFKYTLHETVDVYRRHWGSRGFFSLFFGPGYVHLMFEKKDRVRGGTTWPVFSGLLKK